jgi:hypothetical protein
MLTQTKNDINIILRIKRELRDIDKKFLQKKKIRCNARNIK